jgi:hypothetical protein
MAENEACEDCGAPADVVTCEVSELRGLHPESGDTITVRVPGTARALCRACEARRCGQAGRRYRVRNTIRREDMSELNEKAGEVDGIIQSVKCIVCGTLHDASGKTFARLWGGLLEGISGGLLGGMTGSTYYCKPCFVKAAAKALEVDFYVKREGFRRGIDPGSDHMDAPTGEPGEDSWETRSCVEMGR